MHADTVLALVLLIGAVVLLAAGTHFAARFISTHWPIANQESGSAPSEPKISRGAQRILGSLSVILGGLWCFGLFIARIDPPAVPSGSILIAAGLLAQGINLLGRSAVSGSCRREHWTFVVSVLSLGVWVLVAVALISWHTMIVHLRTESWTRRTERSEVRAPTFAPALEKTEIPPP